MKEDKRPLTLGCRVNDREQARVDAAARLKRMLRGDYIREVVLRQAMEDIQYEANREPGG